MANNDWEVLKKSLTSNAPIKLEYSETSGRGIYAARKFSPNEVIFDEVPLVSGPSQKLGHEILQSSGKCFFCSGCSTTLTPIEVTECSQPCGFVFCNSNCEKRKWHSTNECSLIQRAEKLKRQYEDTPLKTRSVSNWLLVFRCLILKDHSPDKWKIIELLESNSEEETYKKQHLEKYIDNVLNPLKSLFPSWMSKFSDKEVLKVCAKLDSNSFRQGEYCRALFGVASMLNHSCVPNARVVFDAAGNVKVFSKCDIGAGEEITITYVSQLLGTWARKEKLKSNKFFECTCKRCKDPTEFGTYMSGLKCVKCAGYILPKDGFRSNTSKDEKWSCNKCNFYTTKDKVSNLLSTISNNIVKLSTQMDEKSVTKSEEFLVKLIEKHLSVNHCLVQELRWGILTKYEQNKRKYASTIIQMLDDRIQLLKRVDINGPDHSRLLGFLQFRRHCLLMHKAKNLSSSCQSNSDLKFLREDLINSINQAWNILQHDAERPKELTELVTLLNAK